MSGSESESFNTGSRLLCLLICAMDKSEKLITFWWPAKWSLPVVRQIRRPR